MISLYDFGRENTKKETAQGEKRQQNFGELFCYIH